MLIDATLPAAPVIGLATAGDGQATVTFSPPVLDGGAAITGYTVVSNPTGGIDSNAGAPALSHLVTGLTNGVPYTFTVRAINSVGVGPASAPSNSVTPVAAPALVTVFSRKTHGVTDYDVPIDFTIPITGLINVEPRMVGAGHTIHFVFDTAVFAVGNLTVVGSNALPIGNSFVELTGTSTVRVRLWNLPDAARVKFTFGIVNGIPADTSASMAFLVGDISGDRSVSAGDLAAIKARRNAPLSLANFRADVNASGAIDAADLTAARQRSGLKLP